MPLESPAVTQSIPLPQAALPGGPGADSFADRLAQDGQTLSRRAVTTLQINIGKMCNLACHHCHVEAGPGRTEIMTWETMLQIIGWLKQYKDELGIKVVDLTGGAPEMNPHFRELVEAIRALLAKTQPIPRPGESDDIANAAVYLASDESSFVNGHNLVVDGGLLTGMSWSDMKAWRAELAAALEDSN